MWPQWSVKIWEFLKRRSYILQLKVDANIAVEDLSYFKKLSIAVNLQVSRQLTHHQI
jgi:hypothetical protein